MLVGSTGFVGKNLMISHSFDTVFHKTDIEKAYGLSPDILVYAGIPSEMFLANKNPEHDKDIIVDAIENIRRINPKKLVLVSTISVYPIPKEVDEGTEIEIYDLPAYGANRLKLEKFVEKTYEDHLILRLPALFGSGLKKNFLYDFIYRVPSILNKEKYYELVMKNQRLGEYYIELDNGFWKCRKLTKDDQRTLKQHFEVIGFSSLNFTDSRSTYQFYYLNHLWEHIVWAMSMDIKKLNLATEPISIAELYNALSGDSFVNELNEKLPFEYDMRSRYASALGGKNGYIFDKKHVIEEIKMFIDDAVNSGRI